MQNSDIAAGLALCRAAHWNQGPRDWEMFLHLSPDGCRVAVQDEKIIGTVATIRYQENFSWVGMVLVDPAVRRQGIGTQLLQEALTILRAEETVKLDATPAGREVYRRLDFIDEYRLCRMAAMVSGAGLSASIARPLRAHDLPVVQAFDRAVFGADRSVMLEWMLDGAPEFAWVVMANNNVQGYCFGRYGYNFSHLGPVIAADLATAQQLVAACLSQQINKQVILDVTSFDVEWLSWLTSLGFTAQRPLLRMYRGSHRSVGLPQQQFAILGPEFG